MLPHQDIFDKQMLHICLLYVAFKQEENVQHSFKEIQKNALHLLD